VKITSYLVTFSLLIFLNYGCSTSTIVTEQASLAESNGLLVLEIVSNSTNENDKFETISIWSDAEKKLYYAKSEEALDPDNAEMKSTAYFVATLPPGKYWIDSGISYEIIPVNMSRSVTIPMHDQLGSFQITAGEVTNLGTIAYLPNPSDDNPNRFQLVKIDKQHQLSKTLEHKHPKIFSQIKNKPMHSWDELPSIVTNEFIQSHIKNNLYHINSLHESSSGEMLAGGRFGQILHRNPTGKWSNIDTGTTREIIDIAISSDNEIYAMGENIILYSPDNGDNWRELAIPDISGPYMDISISPKKELYLLVRTRRSFISSDFLVLQYVSDSDQWIDKYTLTTKKGKTKYKQPIDISSGFFPDLRYAIDGEHFIVSNGEMTPQSAGITARRPKYLFDGTLYNISDMHIVLEENENGTTVGQHVNTISVSFYDYKANKRKYIGDWPRLKGFYAIDSAFLNHDEGWILIGKNHSLIGKFDNSRLYFTRDRGKSWKKVHELLSPKGRLFVSSSGQLFQYNGDSYGGIYSSNDFGKNWAKERHTYSLQELLDMMK
jgi:photosystem II stability/assembly factor-like uncharacterized protein